MTGLTAHQYLAVWEHGSVQGPVQRALTMLAAIRGEPPAVAARVDIGTRDVQLGRLLAGLAGPTVLAVAECDACGELLEVPVDVAAISAFPVHQPGAVLTADADGLCLDYRLPTSQDLLVLADLQTAPARRALLARCLDVDLDGRADNDVDQLMGAVERSMDEVAPAGAIELTVRCPGCGHTAALPLDVPTLLWAEIEARAVGVLQDVHALASAYGWTEADVLALSPRRRAAYLAMAGT